MITKPGAYEARVRELALELGPLVAFQRLIAENDALFLGPRLDHARDTMAARTAIFTTLIGDWARSQHVAFGYARPFAVVAIGGTGRREMTPRSDIDLAFLFYDPLEGNAFLAELHRQTVHAMPGKGFEEVHGFRIDPFPFSLDGVSEITGKDLNSFLDMRAVYDPDGLARTFRERLREKVDPFEHFLYVRTFWKQQLAIAPACESVDDFDIKNGALRIFQAAVWTLAGHGFLHSDEVYRSSVDAADLAAYYFLLRVRSWVHLRRPAASGKSAPGCHPEDILTYDDFASFGEMLGPDAGPDEKFEFGNEVRARFLSARRRVVAFARGVIGRELSEGRRVTPESPIILGPAGLRRAVSHPPRTDYAKSRAALSLLLASQRYGVEIDPAELHGTFRNAGEWLVRVPELSELFYESRGSLADSFEFLAQIDGTAERLFPGYRKFESSLDGRVMSERRSLRGALERQKTWDFERYLAEGTERLKRSPNPERLIASEEGATPAIQAVLLDFDHRAAVKLALKTKRLPVTDADEAARADQTRPLHERHSSGFSGIPLADYFAPYASECGFSTAALEIARFLVANRRAFKELAETGMSDDAKIGEFVRCCGDEMRLRALYVFTCADRALWESESAEPARWWSIREIHQKAVETFHPDNNRSGPLLASGCGKEELAILQDIGEDFFSGAYRLHVLQLGSHLVRLARKNDSVGPKVDVTRDGTSPILRVAARDYRGLAASITGALWHSKVEPVQAHLFSAMNHGLALDFFHLALGDQPPPQYLATNVAEAIHTRLYIADADEATLPEIDGRFTLTETRPGLHCLRFETIRNASGLIYALTYKVFRHLQGNIHALKAHTTRDHTYISIYYSPPLRCTLEEARAIVEKRFGNMLR